MNATNALGWALLHFLWQGALIALIARMLLWLLPRRHASLRYAVAVGALVLMPATVVTSLLRRVEPPAAHELVRTERIEPTSAPAGEAPRAAHELHSTPDIAAELAASVSVQDTPSQDTPWSAAGLASAAEPAWRERVESALPWIVGAWVLGVLALAVRLLASYAATRRLVRAHVEPVSEPIAALAARLAARLGVRRVVRVWSSALTQVPAVAGHLAPVVLLPAAALSGLSRAELEAVLAHELAHVRRHDYLVNLLQSLIETLLFYHPAVWWLGARIREEREHCCDDLAVAACGSAPLYAEALLSMERLRGAPELALAFTGGSLLARVERLLAPRARRPELFPRWIAGMSAAAIAVLLVATSELAEGARAQQREPVRPEAAQAAQVETGAGDVLRHPDSSQTLAARNEWARAAATERRYREFWIGHSIAPLPAFAEGILMGRFDHTGGLVVSGGDGEGDDNITLMGGMLTTSSVKDVTLPGVPLAPLVNADPTEIGVLYLWSARSDRALIRRVHLATASLAVDLEGLPLLWLGRANDPESVQDALTQMGRAKTAELRRDLVGIAGAHATSSIVVPELANILSSPALDEELRETAAEWLARHPVLEALAALAAAARGDRSEQVRCEAAEAVSEMRFAPAFDVLVALARDLTDRRARAEAVEGLGQRTEPGAVPALLDLVNDPDEDIRNEAVETLGDVPDRAGLSALSALAGSHPDAAVRGEAIETYGECATANDALAFLRELAARDPDPSVRCEAVETLGELHDERVVDVLTTIVDGSEDLDVQREAVETLGETILGAAVTPVLERIARRHPLVEVQREAVETLGELYDEGGRALDAVAAIAGDHPDENVRAEAVETFGEHAEPAEVEALFERLLRSEGSKRVRKELNEALEDVREERR